MTKIETLVKLIDQSSINCHGVDCRECPFDCLGNGRISCALLHLNDANAEDITIKKAIIAAVDEARKEETEPTVGQIWKRKSGFGDPVEITRIVNNLDGTKEVRYSMDDGQFMSGAVLEDFLKLFEKCEQEKNSSHTTPDHSNQAPDYYRRNFKGVEIQVNDITHLWELDADETQAVQYILRAKYKNSGSDELQDLRKAADMLNMAIGWKEFG